MKKYILGIASIALLMGCSSKSITMHKENRNKLINKTQMNLQKSQLKIFDNLKVNATTKEQKYYYNLLKQYVEDYDVLKGKLMDPKTNEDAFLIADSYFLTTKKLSLENQKKYDMDKLAVIQTIKTFEKFYYNTPFYMLKEKPLHSSLSTMMETNPMVARTSVKKHFDLLISFPVDNYNSQEAMNKVIHYFSFLDSNKSWEKHENDVKKVATTALEFYKGHLKALKQELIENENANKSHPFYKARKTKLISDIKKTENTIEYEKNKVLNLDEVNNNILYTFRFKNANNTVQYIVGINNLENQIGVVITKMELRI